MSTSGWVAASAWATNTGSILTRWVPMTMSTYCGAFLLGHATGYRDHRRATAARGQALDVAKARVELFLRALANRAGVDDDQIGVVVAVGRLETSLLQEAGHPLRVVDVHLAAVGLDQVFLGHYLRTFAFAPRVLSPFAFASGAAF